MYQIKIRVWVRQICMRFKFKIQNRRASKTNHPSSPAQNFINLALDKECDLVA